MKTQDLRIGNNVLRLGRVTKITSVNSGSGGVGYVSTLISGAITIRQIEPIRMSKKVLESIGIYEKDGIYEIDGNISLTSSFIPVERISLYQVGREFKYLHEFQNFYYFLTGVELSIAI